jgi:hypothetical protein
MINYDFYIVGIIFIYDVLVGRERVFFMPG